MKCDRLGEEALQRIAVLALRAEEPCGYDLVEVLVGTIGMSAVGVLSPRVVMFVVTGHAVSSELCGCSDHTQGSGLISSRSGEAASHKLFAGYTVCRSFAGNVTLEPLAKHERVYDTLLQLHIRTASLEGLVSYALSTLQAPGGVV